MEEEEGRLGEKNADLFGHLVDRLSGDPWQAGGWIVGEEIGCT